MRAFLVLAVLAGISSAATCSGSALGACVNGLCATGYTCVDNNLCCLNSQVETCVDKINPTTKVSDCPSMKAYCTNSAYLTLMKQQCPKTCGYCTAPCADSINPNTNTSDCPKMKSYCTNSAYRDLMKEQCQKTCGYCK